MTCGIVTERVLEAALRRQLPADQRAALLRHLGEPCEACLDLFEGWPAEEILAMLLAPDDVLSRQERERLFATVAQPQQSSRRLVLQLASADRWRPRLAWGAAAAALAIIGLVTVRGPADRQGGIGLKGAAAPAATLVPLVGARSPTPHVVRALPPGGRFATGELLLLRIRLDAPAWVYLLSQKNGESTELIWPLQESARHEAGEFELAESGSAMAIDPTALAGGGRLLLVASPEPLEGARLQIREPLRTRAELEKTFAGCGVDLLSIFVEPR